MAEDTKIQWTDHTFNPWIGCSKVHTGCTNCYAESFAKRYGKAEWGVNGTRVLTSDKNWQEPLKWHRDAEREGVRKRVFCASLADVFEDWDGQVHNHKGQPLWVRETPPEHWQGIHHGLKLADVRKDLFALIDATPHLDWLLLTKRPENIRRMWPAAGFPDAGVPGTLGRHLRLENVWLGTSVSDQATAEKAIPELLKCRDLSPVLFLSMEPLVGPVRLGKLTGCTREDDTCRCFPSGIDWVIVGGESGNGARECHVEWIDSLVRECSGADVPVFVKQLGANATQLPSAFRGPNQGTPIQQQRVQFKDKKGGDMNEWRGSLQVREFPKPKVLT